MGRRDPTTGELCVGSVYKPGALKPGVHPDEVYDEATRRGIEVVTGPEAEDLIRRVRLTDRTTNLQ
jgi:hypothetical protein